MSMIARVPPGSRTRANLSGFGVLVVPLIVALPLMLLIGALSLGDPVPCVEGQAPTACGAAEIERDRAVLIGFGLLAPLVVYVLTVITVVVLVVQHRRSAVVASLGVGLMAISTAIGLVYRILEL